MTPGSLSSALEHIAELSRSLEALLLEEFEALKASDLEAFEHIQSKKLACMTQLGDPHTLEIIQLLQDSNEVLTREGAEAAAQWQNISDQLADCKDQHKRNEILISRKLDTVRVALEALKGPDVQSSVDTYDRLGRLGGRRGRGILGKV